MTQVAGHLQEKKGYYYAVLSYKDENGRRKTKWVSTKLPVKGNKKKAEAILTELRRTFSPPRITEGIKPDGEYQASQMRNMLFADYMIYWLDIIKPNVTLNTYSGYSANVKSIIAPYFREKGITLGNLQATDIQKFYTERLKKVKPNSVQKYHANIRKALTYAVKMDFIEINPIYKVEKPKKNSFIADYYSVEEVEKLFAAAKDTYLEIPVLLGAFYGFRRSEIIGLRWKMIDFDKNTITINHTVTVATIDGEKHIVAEDRAKTKSSLRTLPLVQPVKEKLIALKEKQEMYQKKFKKSYNKEYLEYVCVDEIGNLLLPNYLTSTFPSFLKRNGFRKIRFHDLRHPYVKLKLKNLFSLYCRLNCAEILHFPYNLNSLIRVNIHFIYEPVSQAL